MDRRTFVKLAPAFPAAAVSASLILKEDGHAPIELDISVLKAHAGDILVLSYAGKMSSETGERIRQHVKHIHPQLKALVLSEGLRLDGVIRPEG